MPPSGKSGKKGGGATGVGSSSSRVRNISHVTNKDSDKEPQTATFRETRKGKKSEQRAKEKFKRKGLLHKSETPSSFNVGISNKDDPLLGRSREMVKIKAISDTCAPELNPNEPPNEVLENDPQANTSSNIKVGSHDLREIQRFANTQLQTYNQEQQESAT